MMEVGMLHEAHFSIAVQSLEYVSYMMLFHNIYLNNERGPIKRFLILCHMITFNHLSANNNNPRDPKTQVSDCFKCTL